MKIKIKNYKCINELNFNLNEDKLNFIYGISGSGKTSISEVIKYYVDNEEPKETEKNVINCKEECSIEVNDTKIEEIGFFDENSVKDFIYEKNEQGVYNLIYTPSENLNKLEIEMNKFRNSEMLKNIQSILHNFEGYYKALEEILVLKYNKNSTIRKNNNLEEVKNENTYEIKHEYSNSKIKWLNEGVEKFTTDETREICPFCNQKIEVDFINEICEIAKLKPDVIKKIQNSTNILENLHIKSREFNNKEDGEEFEKEVKNLVIVKHNVDKIIKMINNFYLENDEISKVNISEETNKYFLEYHNINLSENFIEINDEIDNYLKLCKQYRGNFKQSVDHNLAKINNELKNLNMYYKIEKKNKHNKDESYEIIHLKDNDKRDMSNNLSTGEKNIISLVLFLIINKDNSIIIDDPASSFDEYKRGKILKLIHNLRKENSLFTLVLSHDQIFLKFLLKDYPSQWDAYIFESKNCQELKLIDKNDIDTISNHIMRRLKEDLTYEEKIINLRMYFEIIKNENEDIYIYLSGILHDNMESFDVQEQDEQALLNKIEEKTGVKIEKYGECNLTECYEQVSDFEKIIIKREQFTGSEKKIFNDVLHFNYSLVHMINPYKYNFQVKEIYEKL